ncbi:MAG: HAMP domain-containing protein [Phycisphaerae bacterium]
MTRETNRLGRFFWKLFLGNALVVALVLILSLRIARDELEGQWLRDLKEQLVLQARTVAHHVEDRFSAAQAAELNAVAHGIGSLSPELRVTLIAPDGVVWADSAAEPATMESHADRPEIIAARQSGIGESLRRSHTVGQELLYVAVRVGAPEAPRGFVRLSMPAHRIATATHAMRSLTWKIGAVGLTAALALGLGLALVWSAPLRRITAIANSLSRGDLSARVPPGGADELGDLARSFNRMRDHLVRQLGTIDQQRRNLESLIRALNEAVIVVDAPGRIALTNPAADRLLALARAGGEPLPGAPAGRPVHECVDHSQLSRVLSPHTPAPAVADVRLHFEAPDGGETWLARTATVELAAPGDGAAGVRPGRLVVLTNATELTRAVQMKADFVANASHELRTPLSAIRAAVETLLHMDLAHEADAARHFVEVVDRHSGRLAELASDLLELSRLESPEALFPAEPVDLPAALAELQARFAAPLEAKRLRSRRGAARPARWCRSARSCCGWCSTTWSTTRSSSASPAASCASRARRSTMASRSRCRTAAAAFPRNTRRASSSGSTRSSGRARGAIRRARRASAAPGWGWRSSGTPSPHGRGPCGCTAPWARERA